MRVRSGNAAEAGALLLLAGAFVARGTANR